MVQSKKGWSEWVGSTSSSNPGPRGVGEAPGGGVAAFLGVWQFQGVNERIEMNPRVCGGQPVIRNTRIPVKVIVDQVAEGESWEAILGGYPELTRADIAAAVSWGNT